MLTLAVSLAGCGGEAGGGQAAPEAAPPRARERPGGAGDQADAQRSAGDQADSADQSTPGTRPASFVDHRLRHGDGEAEAGSGAGAGGQVHGASPQREDQVYFMPAAEVSKRIVTMATGDNLPDMFFVPNDFMPQLYDLDIVADLEGLLGEEWLSGYNPNLLKDAKINGRMMSIPWYASPYAVIYRTDWFESWALRSGDLGRISGGEQP